MRHSQTGTVPRLNYRELGNTGLSVSEIGIGGSHFGSIINRSSPKEIDKTLHQALDKGINFYDTADIYGQGESERIIGKTFKKERNNVIIATKAGFCLSQVGRASATLKPIIKPILSAIKPLKRTALKSRSNQIQQNFSADYLIKSVENSLQRLKTDYIDLFQLHEPPREAILDEAVIAALEGLKQQGKIRFYGVACANVDDALLSLEHIGYSSVQVELSLCNESASKLLLPQAQAKSLGIIARQSFGSGKLFQWLQDGSLGTEINSKELVQAALQFVLQFEAVSTLVIGMRRREHLSKNIDAAYTALSCEQLASVRTAVMSITKETSCS